MTLPNTKRPWFSLWLLAVGVGAWLVAALGSCRSVPCPPFQGEWETEEGHRWSFQSDGQLLWIVRFGSMMDTMRLTYQYDCSHSPAVLDLTGFDGGPWQGKTLYGIVEWSSDTVFRFCAAAGVESSVRPEHFDQTETVRFFRAK